MARKWTDEEVQAEIRAAVAIVTEDRERAQYAALHERFGKDPAKDDPAKDPAKDGPTPPPAKDGDPEPEPTPVKRSLWWGDALGDGNE